MEMISLIGLLSVIFTVALILAIPSLIRKFVKNTPTEVEIIVVPAPIISPPTATELINRQRTTAERYLYEMARGQRMRTVASTMPELYSNTATSGQGLFQRQVTASLHNDYMQLLNYGHHIINYDAVLDEFRGRPLIFIYKGSIPLPKGVEIHSDGYAVKERFYL